MVLTAFLLTSLAIVVCLLGVRFVLAKLGLGATQTLLYLGVLETPPPPVSRRRR